MKIRFLLCLIFLLFGCAQQQQHSRKPHTRSPSKTRVRSDYFMSGSIKGILDSFLSTCKAFEDDKGHFRIDLTASCNRAKTIDSDLEFVSYMINNFKQRGITSEGKITGYYQPIINARMLPDEEFKYPIYSKPDSELANLSRYEIDIKGELKGYEMLWFSNFYDVYNLHIQGSGFINTVGMEHFRVAFAGKNNKKYYSCEGRYNQFMKQETGISFAQWATENSDDAMKFCAETNFSYIFFEKASNEIHGSSGAILSKNRSVAVDTSYIPYGSIVWVQDENGNHQGFSVAQDSGSGVKGENRIDVFTGIGDDAREHALNIYGKGKVKIFIPQ